MIKQIFSLSFLPYVALLAFSSLSLPSTALSFRSNGHFAKTTSAISSNLFRSRRQQSDVRSRQEGASRSLLAAASIAAAPNSRDVETVLPGIFWKSFKAKCVVDFDWAVDKSLGLWERFKGAFSFFFLGGLYRLLLLLYATKYRKIPVTVYDARAKEAEEGLSKAEFFDKYGFVILDAPSAMVAEDWEASDRDQKGLLKDIGSRSEDNGAAYNERMDAFRNADTPVKRIYAEETKKLVKSILPRVKDVMPPAKGIRRSVGGGIYNGPATVVHNDYGLVFDEVVENPFFDFNKQREIYEEKKADEYMLINLWRPIKPMSTPLRSLPLCFLDSTTLREEDFVQIDNKSLGITTSLKQNPDHKFYYYPDQTVDEVVVFKQFHQMRNETLARMPVFHTAFPDPAADENTEGRVSFEYRVGLFA